MPWNAGTEPVRALVEAFLGTWQLDRTSTESGGKLLIPALNNSLRLGERRHAATCGGPVFLARSEIRLIRGRHRGSPSCYRQFPRVLGTHNFAPCFDPAPVRYGRRPGHREDAFILDRESELQVLAPPPGNRQ